MSSIHKTIKGDDLERLNAILDHISKKYKKSFDGWVAREGYLTSDYHNYAEEHIYGMVKALQKNMEDL